MAKIKRRRIDVITIDEAYEVFIENCKDRGLSGATIRTYSTQLKRFVDCFHAQDIKEIETLNFIDYLSENYQIQSKISENTIRRNANVFIGFINKNYDLSLSILPYVKVGRTKKEIFTEQEIKALLVAPSGNYSYSEYSTYVIVNLILNVGGLRASSIINLKISDIDFKAKTLFVRHMKNGIPLKFPLNKKILKILKDYLDNVELSGDYLFESCMSNKPLNQTQLSNQFKRYCKRRYVDKTSLHMLRAYYSVELLKQTNNLKLVSLALGHQSVEITEIYLKSLGINDFSQELQKFEI